MNFLLCWIHNVCDWHEFELVESGRNHYLARCRCGAYLKKVSR